MYRILCGCIYRHLSAQVCGKGSLSPGQCVWPGPLVCGQKTEKLFPVDITDLTVRGVTAEMWRCARNVYRRIYAYL